MANIEVPKFWGIHGGKTGDADSLFRKTGRVALGWDRLADLSAIPADRESYKAQVRASYPEFKEGAIPNAAGQLYRFVNEMRVGDFVIYRSKISKSFHIGVVEGEYVYDPKTNAPYPHQRAIKWKRDVSPTSMSQGALYEMGSAMSFFQVKNYSEEWSAALGQTASTSKEQRRIIVEDDESIVMVAESIAQNTRDFILKQFQAELKGHPFAEFVAHLLTKMGYVTRLSPEGPDGGIDIIAHKDELGFEPPIIKVQVKSQDGNVGNQAVAYLSGILASQDEFGLVVALSNFTSAATSFAKGKSNLRLLNADDVIDLTLAHYDSLDPRYKAIIPLKQVFVPEPLDD